jgi:hypothetical protein
VTDYLLLYSSKEYKKVRLRLFVPEFDAWERKYLTAAGSPIT